MKKGKQGFTLMELLIVIVLLGFLIVAGVSSYTSSLKKSRDTKRKNDLRQIALALEAYNNDVGSYPLGDANGAIVGCNGGACNWGTSVFTDTNNTIYMVLLPGDANGAQRYFYSSDGTYFQLYARLENTQDVDIHQNAQNRPQAFSDLICGTPASSVYCNYGVASANRAVETGHTIIYE